MRHFWRQPLGHPHALLLASGLFFTGVMLDLATGGPTLSLPAWPLNAIALIVVALLIATIALMGRRSALVAFLGGVPISTAAIALIGLLTIFAGVLPQSTPSPLTPFPETPSPWFSRVIGSWPFVIAITFLAINITLAVFRRLGRARLADWWFFCVHIGILIILAAMVGGSGDQRRLRIVAREGQPVRAAYLADDTEFRFPVKIPFVVELRRFHMEEYPPRVAVVDTRRGGLAPVTRGRWIDSTPGVTGQLGPWQVTILSRDGNSAIVRTLDTSRPQSQPVEGSLTLETPTTPPTTITLSVDLALTLIPPDPKMFRSDVMLTPSSGAPFSASIEVNKPVAIDGWRLYQTSYDTRAGASSTISVLEAIMDPWLPLAYVGFALTLLGTLRLLWSGLTPRRPEVHS